MDLTGFEIRVADLSDVDEIAVAHRDSIQSIGRMYYPADAVAAWQEGLRGEVYRKAMEGGEIFFIATATVDGATRVLGFASDYRTEGSNHGTSVYVTGAATRHGLGTILLRAAEEHARTQGATVIQIEASLAGVEFYKKNGFVETRRGETRLLSGHRIACVFMRKDLVSSP